MEGQKMGADGSPGTYTQRQTSIALYDLENDLGETTDCSAAYPEVVKRLQASADALRADLGDGDELGPGVRPAARIENLRAK